MVENENVKEIAEKLLKSKNIILRGAPGTGKSYLAKAVASKISTSSSDTPMIFDATALAR